MQLLQTALGGFELTDGNRAIQGDDGGRANAHQLVVQGHDRGPVGLFDPMGACVDPRDCRFDMVRAEHGTERRLIQQAFSIGHERRIPSRSILVAEHAEIAGLESTG